MKINLIFISNNLLIWLGLFVLAFVNGALREMAIKRLVNEPWAHHLSALTAIFMFTFYIAYYWNKTGITNHADAFAVGLLWFILTVLTETFFLNRMISKLSWKEIRETYNIFKGESWPYVLIWILILPNIIVALSK